MKKDTYVENYLDLLTTLPAIQKNVHNEELITLPFNLNKINIPSGININYVYNVINLCNKYSISIVSDFWVNLYLLYAKLISLSKVDELRSISVTEDAFEFMDLKFNPLEKIHLKNNYKQIKSTDLYRGYQCPKYNFSVETPCKLTSCEYHNIEYDYYCNGLHQSDVVPFENIAIRLDMDLDEVKKLYYTGIKKIKISSEFLTSLIEPTWDLIAYHSACSLCGDNIADNCYTYENYNACDSCRDKNNDAGLKLIFMYKCELKTILSTVRDLYTDLKNQANILAVTPSVLKNLYTLVGLELKNSEKSKPIVKLRSGRAIKNSNSHYLALDYITNSKIFGKPTEKTITKLKNLHRDLKSINIKIDDSFITLDK